MAARLAAHLAEVVDAVADPLQVVHQVHQVVHLVQAQGKSYVRFLLPILDS